MAVIATADGETGVAPTGGGAATGGGAVVGGGVRGADLPSSESMDEDELRIESVRQRAGRIYLDAGDFEFAIVVVGDSGCRRSVSDDSRLGNGDGEFKLEPKLCTLSIDTGRPRPGMGRADVTAGGTADSPKTTRLRCDSRSNSITTEVLYVAASLKAVPL